MTGSSGPNYRRARRGKNRAESQSPIRERGCPQPGLSNAQDAKKGAELQRAALRPYHSRVRRARLAHRLAFVLAMGAAVSICSHARGTPQPSTRIALPVVNPAIAELFDQLADDDPQQRENASQSLLNYGALIRPAVLDLAPHAELPEMRARAAPILCLTSRTQN